MGWEEECLPHKNSIEQETIEEERRLAYVGITRAQESLVLTYAKQRKKFGEMQAMTPSRFLEELPRDTLQWEGIEPENQEQQRQSGQAHLAALRALLVKEK
jgi:ATP-dependent DNA helicase Rep